MGGFSTFMTLILGIKFIVKPVMTTKQDMTAVSQRKRLLGSVFCGISIGFICGFVGAGGGMMMLLILTGILGYELKTAVGTSTFIMAFTAFVGASSHFMFMDEFVDFGALFWCVVFTFVGAQVSAKFANKASPVTLNRVTGVVLTFLGLVMFAVKGLT
jgi:uncharacterized membrane protein YfcA